MKDPGKEDMKRCGWGRKEKEKHRGKYTKRIDKSKGLTEGWREQSISEGEAQKGHGRRQGKEVYRRRRNNQQQHTNERNTNEETGNEKKIRDIRK